MTRRLLIAGGLLTAGGVIAFFAWPEKGKDTRYNEETVAIMERVMAPDANGVDVGAFEGTLTEPMTRIAPRGRHFAVEPLPEYAAALRTRFPRVTVLEMALSDTSGTSDFLAAVEDPPRSGFRPQEYPRADEHVKHITVRVARMDEVIADSVKVAFIKIDVEGAEYDVLKGAAKTILRSRPVIVFEFGKAGVEHYRTTPEMMWSLLHDRYGLELALMRTYLDGGPAYSKQEFEAMVASYADWMFVAYPAGRAPVPRVPSEPAEADR